ncbi:MAG TPA: HAD-IC family P-type ATPase [Armatimonadota bacterium]
MINGHANLLEKAHQSPGRLRLRWAGAGAPPESFLDGVRSAEGVQLVEYRETSRSLVVHCAVGFDDAVLRDIAVEHGLLVGEPTPPQPVHVRIPNPDNGGARRPGHSNPSSTLHASEAVHVELIHAAVPGRARFRIQWLRRRPKAAARLGEGLVSVHGVREVQVNTALCTVLIEFDPVEQTIRTLVRAMGELLDEPVDLVIAPGQTLAPGWDRSSPRRAGRARRRPPRETYQWAAAASVPDVLLEMDVRGQTGLAPEEAARRLAAQANNALDIGRRRPSGEILKEQFISVPTVLLGGAAGLAAATGFAADALAIGAVLLINGIIGYVTERYAEGAIEALRKLGFPQAHVVRNGERKVVPATGLAPGDIIRLRAGFIVPADARLIEGHVLVNEAMLTGEGEPVAKHSHTTAPPKHVHEFQNVVFQGTSVIDGRGRAVVLATGKDTELGRIQGMVQEAVTPRTHLQDELDRLGKVLSIGAMGVSFGLLAIALLRRLPPFQTIQTVISLAVSAVPEGLPATATTALAVGMSRMLRRKAIIRRLPAVESLGSVTVLCVDKTGTITLNRMTASCYWWEDCVFRYRNGDAAGEFSLDGHRVDPQSQTPLDAMLRVGVLCNEAKLWNAPDGVKVSGSSTEGALLLAAHAAGYWYKDLRSSYPLALAPRREPGQTRMTSVHKDPQGRLLVAVKGAPESVLALCTHKMDSSGAPVPLSPDDRDRYRAANRSMAENGLRVLAFAQGGLPADASPDAEPRDLVWLGLVGLEDPIRPGVIEAIQRSRAAGIRTIILTGDQRGTALSVARSLGLTEGRQAVMEAHELETMSAEEITAAVGRVAAFARVSPADKLRIVRALQASGHIVAMTGDGINDGPALKAADIGIAMGEGSSDVAKELADVVLTQNDFGSILAAIEQGRAIFVNIRRALSYLVASNVSELIVAAVALLVGIPFPFVPIQILWMNLISDVFPALALVLEPTDKDVMRQPPRAPGTPLIGRHEGKRLMQDAGVLAACTLSAFLAAASIHGYGIAATTTAFAAVTIGEALYAAVWSASSEKDNIRRHGALWGTIGATVALQIGVNHFGPSQRLLHVAPLGLVDYAIAAVAAVLPTVWGLGRSRGITLPVLRHQDAWAAHKPSLGWEA